MQKYLSQKVLLKRIVVRKKIRIFLASSFFYFVLLTDYFVYCFFDLFCRFCLQYWFQKILNCKILLKQQRWTQICRYFLSNFYLCLFFFFFKQTADDYCILQLVIKKQRSIKTLSFPFLPRYLPSLPPSREKLSSRSKFDLQNNCYCSHFLSFAKIITAPKFYLWISAIILLFLGSLLFLLH